VVHRKPVLANGHDGKMAVVVAMAAKQSWQEGRPVKISEVTR
jgi:hypothetical protein